MAGNLSDASIASAPTNTHALSEQLELSQHVQSLGLNNAFSKTLAPNSGTPGEGQPSAARALSNADHQAAPTSNWDKFGAVTTQGLEDIPQGILHTLQHPLGMVENAAISLGAGAAARAILPECGAAGKLFAVGLGVYFAEQTAVPVYQAYKTGFNAKTRGDINAAGNQLGNALGGLVVNLPIGIYGYKLGAGSVGMLRGSAETTVIKPSEIAPVDKAAPGPSLPERYLAIKENFTGTEVTGISREFLANLQVDNSGNYYGAGLRYPDIMADPAMKQYIEAHNQITLSKIDKTTYEGELAKEAKAGGPFGQLPEGWNSGRGSHSLNAIDVTDGGDGTMTVGSRTYKVTDEGAPNRQLLVSDDSAPGGFRTLIPESKDFDMQQVVQVSAGGTDKFAVVGSQDGASILQLYDQNGKLETPVPLPGYGTLHDVRPGASPSQLQFLYDTPILPPHALTIDMVGNKASLSPLPGYSFNSDTFVTEKLLVPYTDIAGKSQTVAAFVSYPKDLVKDGTNLALMEIYGGFDVAPQYLRYMANSASWLTDGRVKIDPLLPGDGGRGSSNYKEALLAGMENDVLAAAAIVERVHQMGISSPQTTGVYGRSYGGLDVNMMLNKRPELFGAAVSESGVNSIIDSPVINPDTGEYWKDEFGDPQDPQQMAWMAKLDVLNNVSATTKYPPTLVEIGTIDGVVNVGNGITYHNIRQGMNNGEVLLYSRIGEGHDPSTLALQTAFLLDRLRPAAKPTS
jgi:hypothetical protein